MKLGRHAEAIADCDAALALCADNAKARHRREEAATFLEAARRAEAVRRRARAASLLQAAARDRAASERARRAARTLQQHARRRFVARALRLPAVRGCLERQRDVICAQAREIAELRGRLDRIRLIAS
jgi:hypothetical protein